MMREVCVLTCILAVLGSSGCISSAKASDSAEQLGLLLELNPNVTIINQGGTFSKWNNGTDYIYPNSSFSDNVNVTNNLTVGGNATFEDEINASGDTFLRESLYVGDIDITSIDVTQTRNGLGSLINMTLLVDSAIISRAEVHGLGLVSHNTGSQTNFTSLGFTANLTIVGEPESFSGILCDSTNPWEEGHDKKVIGVLFSIPLEFGLTGEIRTIINSSCVEIDLASLGADTIQDLTFVAYVTFNHPILMTLDNNFVSFLAKEFEIHIENGTYSTGVLIEDTAGVDSHSSLEVESDIKTFDGVSNYEGLLISSTGTANILSDMMTLSIDQNNINSSNLHFFHTTLFGEAGVDNEVDGWHIEGPIDKIITLGSEDTINASFYDNTTDTINVTANITSPLSNIAIFEFDNTTLYIGNEGNYTSIHFDLSTFSSQSIIPVFFYCDNTHTWKTLTGVLDTTNGMTTSGSVTFSNPIDRGNCSSEIDGTPFIDTNNYTYIAVRRTRNFIVTNPIENVISISGVSDLFTLQEDMINFRCVSSPPEVCTGATFGAIYCDSATIELLWCDGSAWQPFAETADVTNHNALSGLQGGTTAEYYHITASEHSELTNWLDDVTLGSDGNITTPGSLTVDSPTFHVDRDLNMVGIGTTTPTVELDIVKTGSNPKISLNRTGAGAFTMIAGLTHTSVGSASNHDFRMYINNAWRARLTTGGIFEVRKSPSDPSAVVFDTDGDSYLTGGNVGIGTTTPTTKLHVESLGGTDADRLFYNFTDDQNHAELLFMGHTGGTAHTQIVTGLTNSRLTIMASNATDSAPRVAFIGGGDAGGAAGVALFDYGSISYDFKASTGMFVRGTNTTNTGNVQIGVRPEEFCISAIGSADLNCAGGFERFYIDLYGGEVGIGVIDPDTLLEVAGGVHVQDLEGSYSNGEAYVCVYDNGTIFAKDSACS